ncbi:MAG: FkbM family methyltransferase [Paracoccaceae bacterium]
MLSYDEVIETFGIKVPFVPSIITPKIERPMRRNRYEGGEALALRHVLRPGDRVLELGAGVGLLSALSALAPGVERVTAVEANPDLIPLIRETHRLNGVTTVDLKNGIAAAEPGEGVAFYLRPDFWASSMEPASRPYTRVVTLPRFALADLVAEADPTVIVCDIEGGEMGLFGAADLSRVRALVMELHPKVYGGEGADRIVEGLARQGLVPEGGVRTASTVQLFTRGEAVAARRRVRPAPPVAAAAPPPAPAFPVFPARDWPVGAPRVTIVTCMKDEGPFILEWLAWHRAAGVTDFVVFTNDCTDGTDRLLDRLADMGEVTHLPNPGLASGETHFQPLALNYSHHLRTVRDADFVISMDVDEFLNIRTGEGTLAALFAATGPFDVLSVSEINHGANRREGYERGWVKDLFPLHQSERPGRMRARRGVKSIVRLSDRVERIRNHRPDMRGDRGEVRWIDGSGRPLLTLAAGRGENGIDCRGTYELVSLDHFALRSLSSYLVKMFRGDVVITGKQVSQTYWRTRNRNEEATSDFARLDAAARDCHRRRFGADRRLMALHEDACAAHEARIAELLGRGEFAERRDWAVREAW